MKSRILAFAGSKQSGKSTCSNFLHGYQLRAQNVIDDFAITSDGQLLIDTDMITAEGKEEKSKGFLDINRADLEFAEWAAYSMWPYIKNYSFSSSLKQICVGLFEIQESQAYGDNEQKNSKTLFKWEDMPGVITNAKAAKQKDVKALIDKGILTYHKPGRMSVREFLQFFGTDVCRKIYEDVWQARIIKDIAMEEPLIAIIDDCRFPNEIQAIQGAGGKVVYLTKGKHKDPHSSESALDSCDEFDATIDNQNISIHEQNIEIIRLLTGWGWIDTKVKSETPKSLEPTSAGGIHKFTQDSQ
tara:strand:+ start:626 stop:1525 length:900 start_codon:yes stop_codon:yes gene_type:complete